MSGTRKPWHAGNFARRARAVRDAANRNPDTRCWRCGRTKAEHGRPWHAGHLNDSEIGGPLAPECEPCNTSHGAAHGNRNREPHTERWW